MRCTTSTPSAITRPLPLGRSGRRSTLLRSRKSSSRGSAGSSISMTSVNGVVNDVRAHALSSTSADIRSAATAQRLALAGSSSPVAAPATPGWPGARPRSVRRRLRHRDQHLATVVGMRDAVDETQLGQRGDHPRHRRRADPLPDRQCTRRHRAVFGQRRQRRQLRQRNRRIRAAEPQLPGQPHHRQRQVAGQPRYRRLSQREGYDRTSESISDNHRVRVHHAQVNCPAHLGCDAAASSPG